jgi:hypothetical protein
VGSRRASYPRFRRVDPAPPIELTDDDVAILRHLYRHRFLRTVELYRLFSHRSPDKVSRRLARLYRAGFIDRPLAQIDSFRDSGSQPLVYGLDVAGARYLSERYRVAPGADWKGRNRRYTRENLDHTLAVSRFMVDVELACRARRDVELIRFEEMGEDLSPRWPVVLPWHGREATVMLAPDAIFGLRVQRNDDRIVRGFYFVEVDRGSMTIAPAESVRRSEAFLYRSSVLRKLLAYAVSHRDGAHQQHFAIPAARILMLTTKSGRAGEMRAVAHRLVIEPMRAPTGLFVFGTLDAGDDPLGAVFQDVAEAPVRLLPELV